MRIIATTRRTRKNLAAFAVTAALVGAGTVAGASSASAATTWQAMDKVCKSYTALDGVTQKGQICAEVQKRVTDSGSVTGWRGRVILSPLNGYGMKPTTYHWSTGEPLAQVCAGGCTMKTAAWTSAWSPVQTLNSGPYKVRGEFNDGSVWDLHASWSRWSTGAEKCATYAAGKVCVQYQSRGYREIHQERSRLTYTPASGGYIIPRSIKIGSIIDGVSTSKTLDLCDPSCTKRTSAYSATVTRTTPNPVGTTEYYATGTFKRPSGTTSTLKAAITD
ncbi:hypothetical protein AB0I98_08030 [Streptomyces sp. NPDC050211]|uniref:hypothetical protein n=1 Tax=Streptomyces sp. NPDC050211 TaxID=3154932 RepID=UPI00344671B7